MTRPGIEPTTFCTPGEHFTTRPLVWSIAILKNVVSVIINLRLYVDSYKINTGCLRQVTCHGSLPSSSIIGGAGKWLNVSSYVLAWSVTGRLMAHSSFVPFALIHVDNSLSSCVSLTSSSQCCQLV